MYRLTAFTLVLSLVLATIVPEAVEAQDGSPSMEQAAALLQSADWAGATQAFRALTEAEPQNGAAWFGLGQALYESRQADPSLVAYEKALELGFQPPLTMLQLARGHAAKGEDAAAVERLSKAVATGANLYQAIANTVEFQRLQNNAGYQKLIDQIRPCNSAAHRLLDFWVGAWRVVVGEGEQEQQVGKNSINKILNGCAVIENWTNNAGNEGKSLFYFNDVEATWKQVWVSDAESFKEKHLIAVLPGGALRFQGEVRNDAGGLILDRTTLYPLADNRVRQLIEQSADGGDNWQVAFDAFYVRD